MPVAPIYVAHRPQPHLGLLTRAFVGMLAAACLAVLVIAARLTPDASGMETHLQLGLAPCALYRQTGVPCFACGMTTSFAHLAHGHVLASLATQPAGTVFAVLTAMGAWMGGYVAATGRPSARLLDAVPVLRLLGVLAAVGLVGWAYKIVVVLRHA